MDMLPHTRGHTQGTHAAHIREEHTQGKTESRRIRGAACLRAKGDTAHANILRVRLRGHPRRSALVEHATIQEAVACVFRVMLRFLVQVQT